MTQSGELIGKGVRHHRRIQSFLVNWGIFLLIGFVGDIAVILGKVALGRINSENYAALSEYFTDYEPLIIKIVIAAVLALAFRIRR